jgi:ribosomal protein S18 acetylase RimI-like enzyme
MEALCAQALPGWTPEAVSSLLAKASPQALGEQIRASAFAHVALDHNTVVGFILAKRASFLSLLVVDPALQRQGIGSRLVTSLFAHLCQAASDIGIVEVNATQYSLPFYRRLGFYPLSEFIEFDGCRFARLGYWRNNPLCRP